jgi:hypothetical protein
MNIANLPVSLGDLEEVDERFKRWRGGRARGARIPEDLWSAAVSLARVQGVNRTARALGLDYYDLKRRLECDRGMGVRTGQAQPSFVEWLAPAALGGSACRVELENRGGAKMRIELKGGEVAASLERLSRGFWSMR